VYNKRDSKCSNLPPLISIFQHLKEFFTDVDHDKSAVADPRPPLPHIIHLDKVEEHNG
jgi:hypothetical protein